ncbi:MAG: hypothetical protein WDO15_06730 [Bacteroidota bacterium]
MKGTEVIERGDILIENARIKQIGPAGSITTDAQKIDLDGKTVVPGFVDTHRRTCGLHGDFTRARFGCTQPTSLTV